MSFDGTYTDRSDSALGLETSCKYRDTYSYLGKHSGSRQTFNDKQLTPAQSSIRQAFVQLISSSSSIPLQSHEIIALCQADRDYAVRLINQLGTRLKYSDRPNATSLRRIVFEVEWELIGPTEFIRDNQIGVDRPAIDYIIERLQRAPEEFSDSDLDTLGNLSGTRLRNVRESAGVAIAARLKSKAMPEVESRIRSVLTLIERKLAEATSLISESASDSKLRGATKELTAVQMELQNVQELIS